VETILCHESGVPGISGVSSDMRDLLESSGFGSTLWRWITLYIAPAEKSALWRLLNGTDGTRIRGRHRRELC
jgi:acetate kinase